MAARMIELEAAKASKAGELDEVLAAAEKDKRPLSEDEKVKADALQGDLDLIAATIKHENLKLARERGEPVVKSPLGSNLPKDATANPWGEFDPQFDPQDKQAEGAFQASLGAFLGDVARAYGHKLPGTPHAAASGLNTAVPSEGGVLVRTDFSLALLARAEEQANLLPDCTRIPIGENFDGLEAPYIDETSRATGSRWGGVRVFRRAEADTVTASKPGLGKLDVQLEDLMAICYATGRSLQDAPALGALISKSFASEFAFVVDNEIFRGTGVGQCQGLYPGGVMGAYVVSQAAEGGQAVDTVVAGNVQKMFARMPARLIGGAKWYIAQEVWPQLFAMNQANMPVFMPGISLSNAPFGQLLGRPIVPLEQASAIGDVGDITLANMGEYLVIEKGGIQAAESMHVRFLFDEMAFRFIYRINGKPAWKTTLTPFLGAFTLSPFVGLAAR